MVRLISFLCRFLYKAIKYGIIFATTSAIILFVASAIASATLQEVFMEKVLELLELALKDLSDKDIVQAKEDIENAKDVLFGLDEI